MGVADKVVHMSGMKIYCGWDECDKQGYEMYHIVDHEHSGLPCDHPDATHGYMFFCSERHKIWHMDRARKNRLGS